MQLHIKVLDTLLAGSNGAHGGDEQSAVMGRRDELVLVETNAHDAVGMSLDLDLGALTPFDEVQDVDTPVIRPQCESVPIVIDVVAVDVPPHFGSHFADCLCDAPQT